MTIKILKEQVAEYVKRNRLSEAINLIHKHSRLLDYVESREIILLNSRLNVLKREKICGIIEDKSYTLKPNQIANAILNLCEIDPDSILKNRTKMSSNFGQGGVSFKQIKQALQGIKDRKNKIDYHEAVDVLADLF